MEFEKFPSSEKNEESERRLKEALKEIEELKKENLELRQEIEKLKKELIHDSLTGLKTRKYFEEKVNEDIEGLLRKDDQRKEGFRDLSIVFVDIDNFKEINDSFGHQKGDELLKKVAQVLKENVRDFDVAARFGGDEMVIEMLGAKEEEAKERAEELREKVSKACKEELGIEVSISCGVAEARAGTNFSEILEKADKAMYQSKKEKRVVLFSEIEEKENS